MAAFRGITKQGEAWASLSASYSAIRLMDWFWRIERDGRLVATVSEMHGQWRGWIGAVMITEPKPPGDSEKARRLVIGRVIDALEAA